MKKDSIKVLCIGNSFSEDTVSYAAEIAVSLGFADVLFANLYIGGCPIHKHYDNMKNDLPAYKYGKNRGDGWEYTPEFKIRDAIRDEKWDWISIQHGSSYGGRYTEKDSYAHLAELVSMVRECADPDTKIAFNMTWVSEPSYDHPETIAFERDQNRLFETVCIVTKQVVLPIHGIDRVCPTGTAVQNARGTALNGRMSRDGYHMSHDVGRYIAGLVFVRSLTGVSVENTAWRPEGVTDADIELVMTSVNRAIDAPFCIS